MNEQISIILLGATGDLTRRKIIPALYQMIVERKIDSFLLFGAALDESTPDEILDKAREFITIDLEPEAWKKLRDNFLYKQLNFKQVDDYKKLEQFVSKKEKELQFPGNRLVYLAASAEFFCEITQNLATSGLVRKLSEKDKVWQRIVYEKPFGHNLQSALEINACIKRLFNESQIYRIDHYLTKELVGNITLIRFTNCILEPLWNFQYIDNVQIILGEDIDIGNRGPYYDKFGVLADVVQNHMLELLALIAMEQPKQLSGDYIRDKRAKVLEKVKILDGVQGQYNSYQKEHGVEKGSQTSTYVQLKAEINNHRWRGVPFYLKAGKCLDKKETKIHIKFKQVECLFLVAEKCPVESNYLTIEVTPDAAFTLTLNAKKPGLTNDVIPVKMEFCHSCLFGVVTSAEDYVVLLAEIINGEQSVSVRFDEIEATWKIIDKVYSMELPVHRYRCGSKGPEEAEQFEKKHGMRWLS